MQTRHPDHSELPLRHVSEKPAPNQLEVSITDHLHAYLADENGLHLHDAQPRDEVATIGHCQQPFDFFGAHFNVVILGERAGIKEAAGHGLFSDGGP